MTTSLAYLNETLKSRRLELGMKTWRNLAQAAGISYETLRSLRAGDGGHSDATIYGLNRALRFKDGAGLEALLDGQAPELADEVDEPEGEWTLETARAAIAGLTARLDALAAQEERRTASG